MWIERVLRAIELNLEIKRQQRLVRETPQRFAIRDAPERCGVKGLTYEQRPDGKDVWPFTVPDELTREVKTFVAHLPLPVVRASDRRIEGPGVPVVFEKW
jgi:hypothetical protein